MFNARTLADRITRSRDRPGGDYTEQLESVRHDSCAHMMTRSSIHNPAAERPIVDLDQSTVRQTRIIIRHVQSDASGITNEIGGGGRGRTWPRVLFASSEAYPLAKTGGLGDVGAALPASLGRLGIDIRLILPGYLCALDTAVDKHTLSFLPGGGRLIGARMQDSRLPVYLLDRPDLFRRSGGIYQDNRKCDWGDNHIRFAALCRAVVHMRSMATAKAGILI